MPRHEVHCSPAVFAGTGAVMNDETATYLRTSMAEDRDHVERVLTILPRDREPVG